MIFFEVLIFSSSPKLNFFMKTPEATATAAAGVAIFSAHDSISSKPFVNRVTNFGVAANEAILKEKINIKENMNIYEKIFLIEKHLL